MNIITNNKDVYTIGYHGNEKHFIEDFMGFGKDVLEQLSKKHKIQLNIITSNAQYQPNISNIKVNKIEFKNQPAKDYAAHLKVPQDRLFGSGGRSRPDPILTSK